MDASDVAGFVQALTDPAAYEAAFGVSILQGGDLDYDGDVDFDDIRGLVAQLAASTAARTTVAMQPVDVVAEKEHRSDADRARHRASHASDAAAGFSERRIQRLDRRLAKHRHEHRDERPDDRHEERWTRMADRALETESVWRNVDL